MWRLNPKPKVRNLLKIRHTRNLLLSTKFFYAFLYEGMVNEQIQIVKDNFYKPLNKVISRKLGYITLLNKREKGCTFQH